MKLCVFPSIFAILALTGCMSTKVILNKDWDPKIHKVSYVDYFDYYIFGFIGHPSVRLTQVCMDQKPYAFQRVQTAEDGIISIVTLGIYTPATLKVWCGE